MRGYRKLPLLFGAGTTCITCPLESSCEPSHATHLTKLGVSNVDCVGWSIRFTKFCIFWCSRFYGWKVYTHANSAAVHQQIQMQLCKWSVCMLHCRSREFYGLLDAITYISSCTIPHWGYLRYSSRTSPKTGLIVPPLCSAHHANVTVPRSYIKSCWQQEGACIVTVSHSCTMLRSVRGHGAHHQNPRDVP